ncbi:MAG TPA: glycosyltransferase [Phaeodactylibacter sp.]|nr:glycosyltransferase [Phaeodactylibacter sp.]
MQVLVIPSWYYTTDNPISGIFFKEQAKALADTGQLQVVLMYGKFDWKESLGMNMQTDQKDGFLAIRGNGWAPPKVTSVGIKLWLKKYLSLVEEGFEKAGKPDVVHAHSWVAGLVAKAIKARYGIPYVLTEHLSSVNEARLSLRQQRLASRAYRAADGLTAVSHHMARQVESLAGGHEVLVIPNSVDTDFFYPKDQVRLPPRVLLSIGDPWYKKGHDITIKALAVLKSRGYYMELWLGDKIPGRAALEKEICNLGLQEQVKFLGLLSREEVRQVMHKASIYISASRVEPFGVTMIEALACGIPVIATRTAGGIDIIGDQKELGQLVDIGRETELANAVAEMVAHFDGYSPCLLHNKAKDRFSRRAIASSTIDVYKTVLHDNRA